MRATTDPAPSSRVGGEQFILYVITSFKPNLIYDIMSYQKLRYEQTFRDFESNKFVGLSKFKTISMIKTFLNQHRRRLVRSLQLRVRHGTQLSQPV